MKRIHKKVIDVCGTGHSGHSAVIDFLSEFEGVHAHYCLFHFELFRQPGGLNDLIMAADHNWSEISFDYNLKKFLRLSEKLTPSAISNIGPDFEKITKKYVESIIDYELKTDWFDDFHFDTIDKEYRITRIIRSVIRRIISKFRKKRHVEFIPSHTTYHCNSTEFIERTSNYIMELLFHNLNSDIQCVITGNSIEPYQRSNYILDSSESIYSIIVVRDPRDIYASLYTDDGHKRDFESDDALFSFSYLQNLRKSFLGSENISKFVKRQKLTRSKVSTKHERVLLVQFEELVCNYNETARRITEFVGFDPSAHIKKHIRLDPSKSQKNIGLWKNCSKVEEIKYITDNLQEYLYNE